MRRLAVARFWGCAGILNVRRLLLCPRADDDVFGWGCGGLHEGAVWAVGDLDAELSGKAGHGELHEGGGVEPLRGGEGGEEFGIGGLEMGCVAGLHNALWLNVSAKRIISTCCKI